MLTPLRYPGGKAKALKKILPHIPSDYKEFRDIFVGGGSVFLAAKTEINPKAKYVINDINKELMAFWRTLRDNPKALANEIYTLKNKFNDGKTLYYYLKSLTTQNELDAAVRFFILNRITFSGLVDSGGYSELSYKTRFTDSSIEKLKKVSRILDNVEMRSNGYEKLLFKHGENVFIYLDPPYFTATNSKLYGTNGNYHKSFNHDEFIINIKKCPHDWLITYDDNIKNKAFQSFSIVENWEHQYAMDNFINGKAKKGKEIIISKKKV
jgi:DNA adenine methylase